MERYRAGFAAWCAVATVYVAYVDAIESRLDRASVALERAAAFTDVVALGLRVEARRMVTRAEANGGFSSDADEKAVRTKAARLMHTAGSLMATAKDFQHGANLWRRGRLE